jgi:hypothetical protein
VDQEDRRRRPVFIEVPATIPDKTNVIVHADAIEYRRLVDTSVHVVKVLFSTLPPRLVTYVEDFRGWTAVPISPEEFNAYVQDAMACWAERRNVACSS